MVLLIGLLVLLFLALDFFQFRVYSIIQFLEFISCFLFYFEVILKFSQLMFKRVDALIKLLLKGF